MSEEKIVDPMRNKEERPSWWPEDYEGYWSDIKGMWVEPDADTDTTKYE